MEKNGWQSWMLLIGAFAAVTKVFGLPQLIYSNRYNICVVDVTDGVSSSKLLINGLEDASALDFIYEDQIVFWADFSQERIKRANLNGSLNSVDVVTTDLVSLDGLACDWISRKLYWIDSETNHIEVSKLDGSMRKNLVWQDLDQPRAVVLDPVRGYMYWTDWGETAKIERCGMNGHPGSRQIIISTDISGPYGLTIDYDSKRIFWTDARLHYIHSADLDGKNRRAVVPDSLSHPFSISVSGANIYWTDWSSKVIYTCNKTDGSGLRPVTEKLSSPMDVHVFSAGRQPSGNASSICNSPGNGGCSHLCLLSPYPPFYSCECPTGVRLLDDNKTCVDGPTEMLLLVRRTELRRISLDTPDYTDIVLDIKNIKHAIAIGYDPVDRKIYWTDVEQHAIRRANLDGSGAETVLNSGVFSPDGIAVDWVARNIYWTDTGTDRIEVARLNGSFRKVLIGDRLDEPRAITLDPESGLMFWTDWGRDAKIERAGMDGSDRTVIVNSSLSWPNGLAFDRKEGRIYWADAKTDRIEYAFINGSDRRTLIVDNIPHVFGFSLLGDYVYWTDIQRRTIERVHKSTGRQRLVIVDQLPDLMGLAAINVLAKEGSNECSLDNGGCSHLCLKRPSGYVCACPFGMELFEPNGKLCVVPNAFLLYSINSEMRHVSLEDFSNDDALPLPTMRTVDSIDYILADEQIYWLDSESKVISRAFLNGSNLEQVITFNDESPSDMAVDWLARNLYWTDKGMKHIEMSRTDGSFRRILVWKKCSPGAIVVDPINGYLFWSNEDYTNRIERSLLDGSERQLIINNVGEVRSLAVDAENQRLYWTRFDEGAIELVDFNGHNHRVVVSGMLQPFALTLYGDFIYWTDRQAGGIMRADKMTGEKRSVVLRGLSSPKDVTVLYAGKQSGWNPCLSNNGGCSHLCISSGQQSLENRLSSLHQCSCPNYLVLTKNNVTCEAPDVVMFASQKNAIVSLDLEDPSTFPDVVISLANKSFHNVRAIEYNPIDGNIYWIESKGRNILKAKINGSDVKEFFRDTNDLMSPHDLAINQKEGLLYWSDAAQNVIRAMRLQDGSSVGVIVNITHQKPRELALAPEDGLLFWTNAARSIERADLHGNSQQTIINGTAVGRLVVDVEIKRLFWFNVASNSIETAGYLGQDRKKLVENVRDPVGLGVHRGFVYWADKRKKTLERANKYTGLDRKVIRSEMPRLTDLVIVRNRLLKNHMADNCVQPGGRCSHFCVKQEDGSGRCACPPNYELLEDDRTCLEIQHCTEEQFMCEALARVSGGHDLCIPYSWICDGDVDCRDESDEQNCTNCPEKNIRCSNGKCVNHMHICDGKYDCQDGSDEVDCLRCDGSKEGSCLGPGACYSPFQACDGINDCFEGVDEQLCNYPLVEHQKGNSIQYILIGIICTIIAASLLIMLVIYICRRKDHSCTRIYNKNGLVMVEKMSSNSSTMSRRSGLATTHSRTISSHIQNVLPSEMAESSQLSLTSSQAPLNPNPTPIPGSDESEVYMPLSEDMRLSEDSLSVIYNHRHWRKSYERKLYPTPCSTDVCGDSELFDGIESDAFMSSVDLMSDQLYTAHQPSPNSQYKCYESSYHASPFSCSKYSPACCSGQSNSLGREEDRMAYRPSPVRQSLLHDQFC